MKTLNLFKSNLLKGLFVLAAVLYSCNKDIDGFDILNKMSDDALIEAIAKSSDKKEIDYNQLPSSAKTIINEDYETMVADISFKVEDLGYEVKMIDYSPLYVADKNEVYFNKNGRELVSGEKKSEKGKRKKKKSPFKFVFPISFEMPDGSTISANDKQELKSLIKAWRDENPDSNEKPKSNHKSTEQKQKSSFCPFPSLGPLFRLTLFLFLPDFKFLFRQLRLHPQPFCRNFPAFPYQEYEHDNDGSEANLKPHWQPSWGHATTIAGEWDNLSNMVCTCQPTADPINT